MRYCLFFFAYNETSAIVLIMARESKKERRKKKINVKRHALIASGIGAAAIAAALYKRRGGGDGGKRKPRGGKGPQNPGSHHPGINYRHPRARNNRVSARILRDIRSTASPKVVFSSNLRKPRFVRFKHG